MENLKCDLRELLELTRETLREQTGQLSNHCKKDDLSNDDDDGDIDDDPYAHEMALFMSEINSCDEKTELNDEGTSKRCSIDDDVLNKFKVSHCRLHGISGVVENSVTSSNIFFIFSSTGRIKWGDWQKMLSTVCLSMGR